MRVIVCDDQAIVRDGLEMLLKLEKDIDVVGKAREGSEALELVQKHQPDLVLMDLKMPGMNGIEATRRICSAQPNIKVLVLTTYDDDEWLFDALRAGAAGYLLKDTPREQVVRAVRGTVTGQTYVDPAVAGKLLDKVVSQPAQSSTWLQETLTERELQVLQRLAQGMNNASIAALLHLSEGTVRNHISAIFLKLEVSDRTQAAILGIRHGLGR